MDSADGVDNGGLLEVHGAPMVDEDEGGVAM